MKPPIAAAPDPIATLRRYLPLLPTSGARSTAAEAVDALDAELATLRETALDLSRVPEEWLVVTISYRWDKGGGKWWCDLFHARKNPRQGAQGTGPTPRAAMDAAIERAKEIK